MYPLRKSRQRRRKMQHFGHSMSRSRSPQFERSQSPIVDRRVAPTLAGEIVRFLNDIPAGETTFQEMRNWCGSKANRKDLYHVISGHKDNFYNNHKRDFRSLDDDFDNKDLIGVKTSLSLCGIHIRRGTNGNNWVCDGNCGNLHICRTYMLRGNACKFPDHVCMFGHDFRSDHNQQLLEQHNLMFLSLEELRTLFRRRPSRSEHTMPKLCKYYNNSGKETCTNKSCIHLHLCAKFVGGSCNGACKLNHSLAVQQVKKVLEVYEIQGPFWTDNIVLEDLRHFNGDVQAGNGFESDDSDRIENNDNTNSSNNNNSFAPPAFGAGAVMFNNEEEAVGHATTFLYSQGASTSSAADTAATKSEMSSVMRRLGPPILESRDVHRTVDHFSTVGSTKQDQDEEIRNLKEELSQIKQEVEKLRRFQKDMEEKGHFKEDLEEMRQIKSRELDAMREIKQKDLKEMKEMKKYLDEFKQLMKDIQQEKEKKRGSAEKRQINEIWGRGTQDHNDVEGSLERKKKNTDVNDEVLAKKRKLAEVEPNQAENNIASHVDKEKTADEMSDKMSKETEKDKAQDKENVKMEAEQEMEDLVTEENQRKEKTTTEVEQSTYNSELQGYQDTENAQTDGDKNKENTEIKREAMMGDTVMTGDPSMERRESQEGQCEEITKKGEQNVEKAEVTRDKNMEIKETKTEEAGMTGEQDRENTDTEGDQNRENTETKEDQNMGNTETEGKQNMEKARMKVNQSMEDTVSKIDNKMDNIEVKVEENKENLGKKECANNENVKKEEGEQMEAKAMMNICQVKEGSEMDFVQANKKAGKGGDQMEVELEMNGVPRKVLYKDQVSEQVDDSGTMSVALQERNTAVKGDLQKDGIGSGIYSDQVKDDKEMKVDEKEEEGKIGESSKVIGDQMKEIDIKVDGDIEEGEITAE